MDMMIVRNFFFKLLKKKTDDGMQVGITIDGIRTSEERNNIADYLVKINCLERGWKPVGRKGIQGEFHYDIIEKIITSGEIG